MTEHSEVENSSFDASLLGDYIVFLFLILKCNEITFFEVNG